MARPAPMARSPKVYLETICADFDALFSPDPYRLAIGDGDERKVHDALHALRRLKTFTNLLSTHQLTKITFFEKKQ